MKEFPVTKPQNQVAKDRKEVADEYGITVRTLYSWLKKPISIFHSTDTTMRSGNYI